MLTKSNHKNISDRWGEDKDDHARNIQNIKMAITKLRHYS